MDLTIESAIATAERHIERLNAPSEPPTIPGGESNFQPVGSSGATSA